MPASLILLAVAVLGDDPDLLARASRRRRSRGSRGSPRGRCRRPSRCTICGLTSSWSWPSTSMTHTCSATPSCGAARPTPGAARIVCGQVVEQLVEVLAEAVDGLALEAQARVTEGDDGSDGHGARVYGPTVAVRAGSRDRHRRPRRARVAAQQRQRVGAAQHDVEAPAAGAARDVGGHRPEHLDVAARRRGAARAARPPSPSRLRLGRRAILERHGQLDEPPERRRAEAPPAVQLRRRRRRSPSPARDRARSTGWSGR